jgi:DNA ligase D-like protein (predicted polymerase)
MAVEDPLMRAMGGRPVLLQRFPEGVGGPSFFQKRVPKKRPDWLQTAVMTTPNGTTSEVLVVADLGHVLWAVNRGCLGFHTWPHRVPNLQYADELRVDLDPPSGAPAGAGFEMVREAAGEAGRLLGELSLQSWPKTSGNRGVHVIVPLLSRWSPVEVRSASVSLARELERRRPDLITASWWKEDRGQRVFVDFNQNAPHKTVFGAWSVRARPAAQVSTPFSWDELDHLVPDELTLDTVPGRLAALGDPWSPLAPQPLDPLLELVRRDAELGLPDAPWPPVYPKMPGELTRVAPSRAKKR